MPLRLLERISQLSEQDYKASELCEAQEIRRVVFVARDEAAKAQEPRKQSLNMPSAFVAS